MHRFWLSSHRSKSQLLGKFTRTRSTCLLIFAPRKPEQSVNVWLSTSHPWRQRERRRRKCTSPLGNMLSKCRDRIYFGWDFCFGSKLFVELISNTSFVLLCFVDDIWYMINVLGIWLLCWMSYLLLVISMLTVYQICVLFVVLASVAWD